MARMSDNERFGCWRGLMSKWSRNLTTIPILKADLRAAVNALDDYAETNIVAINLAVAGNTLNVWIQTNATGINNAFPEPAKSLLSNAVKNFLFNKVVEKDQTV